MKFLAAMSILHSRGNIHRVLIICPQAFCDWWAQEVTRYGDAGFNSSIMLDGIPAHRVENFRLCAAAKYQGYIIGSPEKMLLTRYPLSLFAGEPVCDKVLMYNIRSEKQRIRLCEVGDLLLSAGA